jgi:hypothetical protein
MTKPKRHARMLGITLGEHRCGVALVERAAGDLRLVKAATFRMALDVLKDSPDLVGAELSRHLAEARVTERSCVAVAPANWFLTAQAVLPPMDPQDEASYLELQAEHLIPVPPADLILRDSVHSARDGERTATLLALPAGRAAKVLDALRHARLHPRGLVCSAAVLAGAEDGPAVVLQFGPGHTDLAVTAGGGLVALRTLRESESPDPGTPGDELVREIQITLRRLSPDLADQIHEVTVYGRPPGGTSGAALLEDLFQDLGLDLAPADFMRGIAGDASTETDPAAVIAAARTLGGRIPELNFLTVRPGRARVLAKAILKRRALSVAAAAIFVVTLAAGALVYQHHTLRRLEAEHDMLGPMAAETRALQDRVRAHRDWCDTAAPTLEMMRVLTESFPETGGVWLRTLGIRDLSGVTCAGSAASGGAFLAALDALGATPGVRDLKVSQVRGDTRLDFNFTYTWEPGAK